MSSLTEVLNGRHKKAKKMRKMSGFYCKELFLAKIIFFSETRKLLMQLKERQKAKKKKKENHLYKSVEKQLFFFYIHFNYHIFLKRRRNYAIIP